MVHGVGGLGPKPILSSTEKKEIKRQIIPQIAEALLANKANGLSRAVANFKKIYNIELFANNKELESFAKKNTKSSLDVVVRGLSRAFDEAVSVREKKISRPGAPLKGSVSSGVLYNVQRALAKLWSSITHFFDNIHLTLQGPTQKAINAWAKDLQDGLDILVKNGSLSGKAKKQIDKAIAFVESVADKSKLSAAEIREMKTIETQVISTICVESVASFPDEKIDKKEAYKRIAEAASHQNVEELRKIMEDIAALPSGGPRLSDYEEI